MTKPITFNYQDHVKLKADYKDLLIKYAHLKAELTDCKIRCLLLEANLEKLIAIFERLKEEERNTNGKST